MSSSRCTRHIHRLCAPVCLLLLLTLHACALWDYQCRTAADCAAGQLCQRGLCLSSQAPDASQTPTDQPPTPQHQLDQRPSPQTRPVDVLFVIDNSSTMQDAQRRLAANIDAFIDTIHNKNLDNVQFGVITTDMKDDAQAGKLQHAAGHPKILQNLPMSRDALIRSLSANLQVGTKGSTYEKGLQALKTALSPPLLNQPQANKGFLRPLSILVIVFVTDENDCSHNGKIPEDQYPPEVCYLPQQQALTDKQGRPFLDDKGQPIRGQLQHLIPTQEYISFLYDLEAKGHKVLVSGILGDPTGGSSNQCTASPGSRYHDLIKFFGRTGQWLSICQSAQSYRNALARFAQEPLEHIEVFSLSRTPTLSKDGQLDLEVTLRYPDQSTTTVPQARPNGDFCELQSCAAPAICGSDGKCYDKGWLHFAPGGPGPGLHKLRLSGSYRKKITPRTKIEIKYLAKP